MYAGGAVFSSSLLTVPKETVSYAGGGTFCKNKEKICCSFRKRGRILKNGCFDLGTNLKFEDSKQDLRRNI